VRRPSLARRILPWIFAAVTLGWLVTWIPAHALDDALRRVDLKVFVFTIVVYTVLNWFGDSLASWATFATSLPDLEIKFGEVLELRAASYLLGVLHYTVGQGGVAFFLYERRGGDARMLARAAGAVLLTLATNSLMTALCAFAGVLVGGAPELPIVRWLIILIACALPAYVALILARPGFLVRRAFLRPLFDAGLRGHAVALIARVPHISFIIVGNWILMRQFGVHPSLGQALALLPIVFVVSIIPVTPSGLGTSQGVTVFLFEQFVSSPDPSARKAAVLAYSLAAQVSALLVQAVIGLVFLRRVSRAAKPSGPT
jgi:uncharacterized membrane protein YbhN (UPF0104 family)